MGILWKSLVRVSLRFRPSPFPRHYTSHLLQFCCCRESRTANLMDTNIAQMFSEALFTERGRTLFLLHVDSLHSCNFWWRKILPRALPGPILQKSDSVSWHMYWQLVTQVNVKTLKTSYRLLFWNLDLVYKNRISWMQNREILLILFNCVFLFTKIILSVSFVARDCLQRLKTGEHSSGLNWSYCPDRFWT